LGSENEDDVRFVKEEGLFFPFRFRGIECPNFRGMARINGDE
jgi:hypothetical protein